MSPSNPRTRCPGSFARVTSLPILRDRQGTTILVALCAECGRNVPVRGGRMIVHLLPQPEPVVGTKRPRWEPIEPVNRQTLMERIAARR